ncbi:MAG: UMP kinase [Candidatus Heimdallarchaeota archaeon]
MFVVKIGGSILFDEDDQINEKLITKYAKTIRNVFTESKKRCAIVVGGGKLARKYIASSRRFGADETYNDIMGIEVAKLNARLLISALGELANSNPPNNIDEFTALFKETDKIIVCGGFRPGQSTNAVAAEIAEAVKAEKLFNLTDVAGVYSDDPVKNPDATLLDKISIDNLIKMVSNVQTKAGYYPLFDITAAQIIKRSKIPLQFINGRDPENLEKAFEGEKIGTMVS